MTAANVPEITPEEVARAAELGKTFQVLDVRPPQVVQIGAIDIMPEGRFFNVVGSRLASAADPEDFGLRRDQPIAVVCARGVASRNAAAFLIARGFDARSVAGGMSRWMTMSIPRPLEAPAGVDAVVQFDRLGKGSLGYLVVSRGEALLVDPPRHAEPFLEEARRRGADVVGVADTHVHADFISGSPGLSRRLGVPYYLHAADNVYPYDGRPGALTITDLSREPEIAVGDATIRAHHTPGHTEGSVSFLIGDGAVFSGDFLFVASIGRPDLGGKVEDWALLLWDSLETARAEWSGAAQVLPAHYASATERSADGSVGLPFARLLERNEPAAMTDRAAFIDWVVSRRSAFPDAYRQIKAINVGLVSVSEDEADELEIGRNECAVA